MIKENSLTKLERVNSRTEINNMFTSGASVFTYPFKCVYIINDTSEILSQRGIVIRMMVSVGKKYHKRAVKRNRVKRMIREAYRLNKSLARDIIDIPEGKVLSLCFIYCGKTEEPYKIIEDGVKKTFEKISKVVNNDTLSTD